MRRTPNARPISGGLPALLAAALLLAARSPGNCGEPPADPLPPGVKAVWDPDRAMRESTATRERICINGLWRFQPGAPEDRAVPAEAWGHFKVPGCWPGITDYLQKDCQTVFFHPAWKEVRLRDLTAAWYQREITVPAGWAGRRITVSAEGLNSFAVIYLDGREAGRMRFPAGEVEITGLCRPGEKHLLSLLVVSLPLKAAMASFSDTAAPRQVAGRVARRGLCGDLWLESAPAGGRIGAVRVETAVTAGTLTLDAGLEGLADGKRYLLKAAVMEVGRAVREFQSRPFRAGDLAEGRISISEEWKPERLWDLHTPQNLYRVAVSLHEEGGALLDAAHPSAFGFRQFEIRGRDFFLNGSRLHLSALPLDNAQVGAAWAGYRGVKETLLRLKGLGINLVYTHNYGCEPGAHLSFAETLQAADDAGMLVALSQPHFGQYDWKSPEADRENGYAAHAAYYARVAGNHPSVVFYSMSHNATGYSDDMNPDLLDGASDPRDTWSRNNARLALRAEAIVRRLDPGRIVYHHSSGNLGSMHTTNFYTNFAPLQELDDWFGDWAARGTKPIFTCEYMVPCTWDWTMYRGWYQNRREFGSAQVPWDFSLAEWNAQFLGDRAYRIGEPEKVNIRWEAKQYRAGKLWHRWDYPYPVGSKVFEEVHQVIAAYLKSNWRAFRTWGLSANSPWEHHFFFNLREGVKRARKELPVDWDDLQRPGFSADYLDQRPERWDLDFDPNDWAPAVDGQAILENNRPLLAWIAGKPEAFTSKDHLFVPGERFEKQLIVINDSRETVSCDCRWSLALPEPLEGTARATVPTGDQARLPLAFTLPAGCPPGRYGLTAEVRFSTGETQRDSFTIEVLPRRVPPRAAAAAALFDPRGETEQLLRALGFPYQRVTAAVDLTGYSLLIVGKGALTPDGPAPDLRRVREGLRVLVFEQTAAALEGRFGFRVAEYGLRQVFRRVPDHPLLAGLDEEQLRDWRGAATLLPPRLTYTLSPRLNMVPVVKWCGLEVSHVWRCGNRGNVASVLIEKPARGDFLPLLEGGYSLQYSPLLACREGKGLVLFCQLDVTGRTESDPAAERLAGNLLEYLAAEPPPAPAPSDRVLLLGGGPEVRAHLEAAGLAVDRYSGGPLPAVGVLIAAPGEAPEGSAPAIVDFLKSGGRVLALGLDEAAANALLPFRVEMKKAEHLASFFEPPPAGSFLAGVGPSDVHDRDPRERPLVSEGAAITGNGVLGAFPSRPPRGGGGAVVFCQLVPYQVSRARGARAGLTVTAGDAAEGKQSVEVSLGSVSPRGARLGQRVAAGEPGQTYTFAVFARAVGAPVAASLEIGRGAAPDDRLAKGEEVMVPEDRWTELHLEFKVERRTSEGWLASVASAQEGGRLRLDGFRLQAGGGPNLFRNAGFESGGEGWLFTSHQQHHLRRTFRRSSFLLARLLANLGAAGRTPLLERFSTPVKPGEERWLSGFYLDEPEEWDDPYRFFRW